MPKDTHKRRQWQSRNMRADLIYRAKVVSVLIGMSVEEVVNLALEISLPELERRAQAAQAAALRK